MQVETKNASLDTLAVTIQALHVSGKQMTLAVFRQLPTDVERDDSELWGVVRYAIKDEGAVWLVFSHDGALRRRALDLRTAWADERHLRELKSSLAQLERNWTFYSQHPASVSRTTKETELLTMVERVKLAQADYNEKYAEDAEWCASERKLAELTQLFIAV